KFPPERESPFRQNLLDLLSHLFRPGPFSADLPGKAIELRQSVQIGLVAANPPRLCDQFSLLCLYSYNNTGGDGEYVHLFHAIGPTDTRNRILHPGNLSAAD